MTFDPSSATPANQFDPMSATPDAGPPIRTVLEQALPVNPDQAAQADQLAKRMQLPQDVVARNLTDVRLQSMVEEYDQKIKTSPVLLREMRTRQTLAQQAHDDIEPLKKIESGFASLSAAGAGQAVLGISESIWRTPDAAKRLVGYLAGIVEKTGLPRYLNPIRGAEDLINVLAEGRLPVGPKLFEGTTDVANRISNAQDILTKNTTVFGDLQKLGENADLALKTAITQGNVQQLGQVFSDPKYWTAFLGQAAPSLYTAIKSGGSTAFMGWMEGMEQAGNAADFEQRTGVKISDAEFSQAVMQTAIVNSLLEKTGLDKVMGAKGKGVKGIFQAIMGEGGTEALQQINSNLSAMLTYDNGKSLLEGVVQSFMGGAGAGGGVSTAGYAASKAQDYLDQRASQNAKAEAYGAKLQEAMAAAAESKLRQRNPETFRELAQQMATGTEGAPQTIFIDAQVLAQAGPELTQALPSVAEQLDDALRTNSMVEVPIADVLTVAPGTPLEQLFLQNARASQDSLSLADAQASQEQAAQFIKDEADRVMQQAADQQAWQHESERVKAQVLGGLDATGRFSADVNDAYATLQSAFYSTMAARLGTTPMELFNRRKLQIAAKQAGQGGVLNTGIPAPSTLTMPDVPPVEAMQKYSRTESVPLSKAVSFQSARNWDRFNTNEGPGALVEGYGDKPLALRLETGEYVIYDGNHRTDRAIQNGETAMDMYVIDVKSYDPAHAGRKPVPGMSSDELLDALFNQQTEFDQAANGATPYTQDTITIDGKERSALNSNGQRIAATEEGLRNFWAWFGDSKVVDASGKPLVVYHGTDTGGFTAFYETGGNVRGDLGIFATSNREMAKTYVKRGRAQDLTAEQLGEDMPQVSGLYPVYMKIENPGEAFFEGATWSGERPGQYQVENADGELLYTEEGKAYFDNFSDANDFALENGGSVEPAAEHYETTDSVVREARQSNNDGAIIHDVIDDGGGASSYIAEPSTVYVTFDPTHVKSATGNNGQFNPQDANILRQDAADLVVTHNLTADNLLHAVKMGGIAVPSLAVTKKDNPLTGFGEITLIGDKALADPKGYAGTKVFGADIYSPRYPSVTYEFTPNMKKRAEAQLKNGMEATDTRYIEWSEVEREGARELERNAAFLWTFLTDKGIAPVVKRTEVKPLPPALAGFATDTRLKYELLEDPAFVDAAWQAHLDMLTDAYKGDRAAAEAEVQTDRARAEERGRSQIVSSYADDLARYQRDLRDNGKIDKNGTRYAMEEQVRTNDLTGELEAAAKKFIQDISPNERIFQGYTNSGNRKYVPHTLENVVKILKKELRGGENFNYGVGSLRAKFTPQFKSIDQIRKAKDRLVSKADFEKVKAEIDAQFWEAAAAINGDLSSDTAIAIMEDAAKMGVQRAAKSYGYEVSDEAAVKVAEFLTRLRELPTEYFEAKILREVDLAEFSAAVVPEGVDPKVTEALQARGVTDIRTYKKGDETDRAAKIREFENLFFQNQQNGPRGTFNPQTLLLTLNENADLSTFLHESGHFFLEVMADLASQSEAPQQIRDDMKAVLQWFGVRSLATWNQMTLDEKRPYHERWAESFEQYLFEGKAPSAELQPLFRRFRSWMVNVYKSLTQFMRGRDLKLNDEVRQVFDRLIATDEQIAQAEEAAGMLPDFDATNEAIEALQARSLRDLKWTVKARGKVLKALKKEAKTLREEVEAEVRAEVEQQPLYKAMNWLKKGETTDTATGDTIKAEKGFRLLTTALAEMYPDTMLARPDLAKLKGMTGKEGLHPDMVADMFGFESGDALVRNIIDAEPIASVIEGMTDQRMLERHGELATPEALEAAANEAVHNEARARSLATELKSQSEMMNVRQDTGRTASNGRAITVNAITNAAKQFAENLAARRRVKDLKSAAWQHRSAEARAGKAWQEATSKGKTEEAVQAKRDQVLNNAAAKALQEAQAEVRKILEFFKRVTKGNDEKIVERGRDPDVVNAMRAILGAYDVAPKLEKSALAYMETVAKNDPVMYAALQPSVQGAMLNAKPLTEMTMEELRGLNDELRAMWALAKSSRQSEIDGNLVDREMLEDALVERMGEIGIPDTIPGEKGAITDAQERGIKLQFAKAILSRVEQWSERMDGKFGGPFLRYVFQPIKEAADRYRTNKAAYREKFTALVKDVAPYLPAGPIEAPELGYTFGNARDSGAAELLHAVLHTGNDSNKRKLLLGRGWATQDAEGNLDTTQWDNFIQRMQAEGKLRKEHYDFAQGVWDLLEEIKPLAQQTHRRVFGRYFAEVTANEVVTPFGTYRGGYVPAQTDSRLVKDAKLRELAEGENESMAYAFPAAPSGFTKSRVEYNQPLLLDLRALGQHMDKVLLFSHMQGVVTDVRRLLTSKRVSYALDRIDPGAYEGMLIPWLNRSARQVVETPVVGDRKLSRFLSAARSRAGMALMFANLSNTVQQITGFTMAGVKVKPGLIMSATARFMADPKAMKTNVAGASPYMKDRMLNEVGAMNDAVEEILVNPTLLERGQTWTQRHAYFMQAAVDNTMSPIIWTAAYNQAIAQKMEHNDAVRFADGVTRQTQGTTLPEDISRFESGPGYARLFTQFVSYFNMMANTNATAVKQIADEGGLKKGAGKVLYVAIAGLLAPIWVAEAIAQAFRGGPEDEDKDGWLDDWLMAVFGMGTLRGLTAQVPIVGQAAQLVINRFNDNPADDKFSLSPAVSLIESTVSAPSSVYKAIVEDGNKQKAVRDVAAAATMITGLPIYGVARPIGYLAGMAGGTIEPTGPVDLARGLVTGTASPDSKQR